MPEEHRAVEALIERLVRESQLPDERAREELRRELATHFQEAGDAPDALRAALDRFGNPQAVADGFRRAYRRGRPVLYAAKVFTSVVAAAAAALAVQLLPNLHLTRGSVHLGRGYVLSACFSMAIILVLVAAWELDIEPLCARLERRPLRLAGTFGALFAGTYIVHPSLHAPMGATHVAVASAAAVVVWACTVAIVARLDLAFLGRLGSRKP